MAHRYFTDDFSGEMAQITGADAAHLSRVLRVKKGEVLTLCDGAGTDYDAAVEQAEPTCITLRVLAARPSQTEPLLRVAVYFACGKGDKNEWIIQKAVELGAASLHPFFSQNTVAKPKNEEEKNKRYNRVAAEAAKQSGRGVLPQVAMPQAFDEALREATSHGPALLLHEAATTPLRTAFAALPPWPQQSPVGAQSTWRLALFTGPEGGFAPEEAVRAAAAGCVPVRMGPRILRCETAPVAALAALLTLAGEMD